MNKANILLVFGRWSVERDLEEESFYLVSTITSQVLNVSHCTFLEGTVLPMVVCDGWESTVSGPWVNFSFWGDLGEVRAFCELPSTPVENEDLESMLEAMGFHVRRIEITYDEK